jgi:putative transcriptional regulator
MSITRHPDDSTLLSYAAGSLPGAFAAVVAAHLALCPRCREEVATMEVVGGLLLAGLPGAALRRRQPRMAELQPRRPAPDSPRGSLEVPAPLARLVGGDLDALRWRWISPGLWLRWLACEGGGRLYLLRGAAGVVVPEHGHHGSELTMVLRGTLVDRTGRYRRGDVCDVDEAVEHTPAAGDDGCICVVAQDHPVRWRRLLARLARPWHGM